MTGRKDILRQIRQVRNEIFARGKRGQSATEKLRYKCWQIDKISLPGQDWSSAQMPDPLFKGETGHTVRVVKQGRKQGIVISLTGRKILGRIQNMHDASSIQQELAKITGASGWIQRKKLYEK